MAICVPQKWNQGTHGQDFNWTTKKTRAARSENAPEDYLARPNEGGLPKQAMDFETSSASDKARI